MCKTVLATRFNTPNGRYERIAWIPVFATFIVVLGLGGKNLGNPPPLVPLTVSAILGFAGTQAGLMIAWAGYGADYATYLHSHGTSFVNLPACVSITLFDISIQAKDLPMGICRTCPANCERISERTHSKDADDGIDLCWLYRGCNRWSSWQCSFLE